VIRIRRRAVGLLGGALLLFLAATNIQSGWLFALSSLLLGALVAGTLVPLTMVRGLHVERRGPPQAFVGEHVPVDLLIENRARGTRISVVVRDPHVAPTASFLPAIRAGEQVKVRTLRLATRRGVVESAPVEVASTAPFGVAEARRAIESSGQIVIFPRVVPLGRLPFLEETVGSVSHPGPIAQRGDGQEFIGVRDYRYGDSLRSVHWPSTARRGTLVVREMEIEHPASLVILVDTWADGGIDQTVMDLCCTVAASVAMKALSTGHDVLLAAAEGGRAGPPARMGRQEALTWLAGLAAPGGLPLPAVVEQIGAVSARTALLIVLPTWRPSSAAALHRHVARIAAGGMPVVAVLIDAARFDPRAATLDPAGVLDLERSLASAGAEVRRVASTDDMGPGLGRLAGAVTIGPPVGAPK
jgi:uncharacterized protein (DUF58 family)